MKAGIDKQEEKEAEATAQQRAETGVAGHRDPEFLERARLQG